MPREGKAKPKPDRFGRTFAGGKVGKESFRLFRDNLGSTHLIFPLLFKSFFGSFFSKKEQPFFQKRNKTFTKK